MVTLLAVPHAERLATTSKDVMRVSLSNIAIESAKLRIDVLTRKHAKNEQLNYSMSSSLNSHLRMMIALCAFCHFRLKLAEEHTNHAVGT